MQKCKYLTLDEMQEVLGALEHTNASVFAERLESIGDEMAREICLVTGLSCKPADCAGTSMGGTCVSFHVRGRRRFPEVMELYDQDEW